MTRLILILMVLLTLSMPYILTHTKITDFGSLQNRKEYAQVFKTAKGNVYVFDKRVTPENEAEFRLPAKFEHHDARLYQMLLLMEGKDDAVDLYKGVAKGLLSSMGANYGGGSTLSTSVAGSLLHNRVMQPNTHILEKILNRVQEWFVVGYINSLPEKEKQQLILSEACQYGPITGCNLVASQLWGRVANNDTERLLLAATVRYPLSEQNKAKIGQYTRIWCQSERLKSFQFGRCEFDQMITKLLQEKEGGVRLSNQINQMVVMNDDNILKPLDIITVVETIKGIQNADVELRIQRVSDHQLLFQAANNSKLLNSGFNSQKNIASVAKLLPLLKYRQSLPNKSIECMAKSDNSCMYEFFSQYSEFELQQRIKELGLNVKYGNDSLMHAASFGNIAMSSNDVHHLLAALAKHRNEMPLTNQYAMKSAIGTHGTLRYAKNAFGDATNILIAKSGTHANRTSEPLGVAGNLAVFAVKTKNDIYTVVLRLHAKRGVICVNPNCTQPTMKKLVELSGYVFKKISVN